MYKDEPWSIQCTRILEIRISLKNDEPRSKKNIQEIDYIKP